MLFVTWRPPWLSVVACALVGLIACIRACEPDDPHRAPRMVWVGNGYVAVWEDSDGDETLLQAAQLSETGAKRSQTRGRTVWRSDELQSRPVLAGGDRTALVLALEGPDPDPDPDEDRSDPPRFLTVLPLGADGRELGTPRALGLADRICKSPVWDGSQFAVAFAYRLRRFGSDWSLQLAGISADGRLEQKQIVASGHFLGCAIARHGDLLALVTSVEDRDSRRYSIVAYLFTAAGQELLGEPLVLVAGQERVPWPGVVSDRDGWAVSFVGKDDVVRLVRFDQDGVRETRSLDAVDSQTVSLGSNDAGVFVAWHAKRQIRLRDVDRGTTRSIARAPSAETAVVGHGSDCAIAWHDGKRAVLSRVPSPCP